MSYVKANIFERWSYVKGFVEVVSYYLPTWLSSHHPNFGSLMHFRVKLLFVVYLSNNSNPKLASD
jgi:hypothetical protein